MLKFRAVALLSLSLMVVNASAQEVAPSILPNEPLQPIPAGQVGDKEKEPNKPDQGEAVVEPEWQPRVRLVLNEARFTQAVITRKPVTKTRSRTVTVPVRVEGETVRKEQTVQEQYTVELETVTEGATIIDCDEVSMKVTAASEEGKDFAFEIEGRLILRNGSTVIEAENAALTNGKLTLSQASLKSPGLNMNSAELILELNVVRLRIGDVKEPEPESITPPTFPANDFLPSEFPSAAGGVKSSLPQSSTNDRFQPAPERGSTRNL